MGDDSILEDELAIQNRVLVEADLLGKPVGFRTLVVKVAPDELWLGMSSPDRRLETMIEHQPVRLTVAGEGHAMVGASTFLRPLGGGKSRVFAVAKPTRLAKVQRRAHLRYRLAIEVQFRYLDQVSREPRGKAYSGRTIDVSPAGALFVTAAPLQVGDEIGMTLPLAGGDRVSVIGLVTRSVITDPPQDVDGASGVGASGVGAVAEAEPATPNEVEVAVRFSRITAVDQNRVLRFILMVERRRRQSEAQQPAPVAVSAPAPATAPVARATPAPSSVGAAPAPAVNPVLATEPVAAASTFRQPATPALPTLDADAPAIAVGLRLCENGSDEVRKWFDSLMPFDRIELLSQIQANMAGTPVPGAPEPTSVRPLAVALGLLTA